ncbi:hypothetical protein [Clostridium saccharoperbutylacetonicum]|uniref:hypothetical protein n=1 Tax=Clostridium saccharoperbutylacetonicum TaxID=36745 RepID=UPI0039E84E19
MIDLQHKDLIINICLIISFLITVLLILFFNHIIKSIAEITKYAKQISDGKLNISNMEIESGKDVFLNIEKNFNEISEKNMLLLNIGRSCSCN